MFHFKNRCWAKETVDGTGRYYLIGEVPLNLAFETDCPDWLYSKIISIAIKHGELIAKEYANRMNFYFSRKYFSSKEEAKKEVEKNGYIFMED